MIRISNFISSHWIKFWHVIFSKTLRHSLFTAVAFRLTPRTRGKSSPWWALPGTIMMSRICYSGHKIFLFFVYSNLPRSEEIIVAYCVAICKSPLWRDLRGNRKYKLNAICTLTVNWIITEPQTDAVPTFRRNLIKMPFTGNQIIRAEGD